MLVDQFIVQGAVKIQVQTIHLGNSGRRFEIYQAKKERLEKERMARKIKGASGIGSKYRGRPTTSPWRAPGNWMLAATSGPKKGQRPVE